MIALRLLWRWTARTILSARGRVCLADAEPGALAISDAAVARVALTDEVAQCP